VETLSGFRIYPFDGAGIAYGLLAIFQRRAYVFGATQRGIFYRIGAQIFSPCTGYFDSTFALKTKISEIDLMLKVGMKDEIIPCWFRPNWIHGAIHLSRTGCISFVFTALDPKVFPKSKGENVADFSTAALYSDGFYDEDNEKRKQLDSY
jgi:hypothetical protein